MLIKILIVIVLFCIIWINFDNFRIKRKATRLSDKVERLTEIVRINYLQNLLDILDLLI